MDGLSRKFMLMAQSPTTAGSELRGVTVATYQEYMLPNRQVLLVMPLHWC